MNTFFNFQGTPPPPDLGNQKEKKNNSELQGNPLTGVYRK